MGKKDINKRSCFTCYSVFFFFLSFLFFPRVKVQSDAHANGRAREIPIVIAFRRNNVFSGAICFSVVGGQHLLWMHSQQTNRKTGSTSCCYLECWRQLRHGGWLQQRSNGQTARN